MLLNTKDTLCNNISDLNKYTININDSILIHHCLEDYLMRYCCCWIIDDKIYYGGHKMTHDELLMYILNNYRPDLIKYIPQNLSSEELLQFFEYTKAFACNILDQNYNYISIIEDESIPENELDYLIEKFREKNKNCILFISSWEHDLNNIIITRVR